MKGDGWRASFNELGQAQNRPKLGDSFSAA
jgi:hypothetical protein